MTDAPTRSVTATALPDLVLGSMITQVLHVSAVLGLPEALAAGPVTAAEAATAVGADQGCLTRLLRLLCGLGLVDSGPAGFSLSPAGQALRPGVPGTVHDLAVLMGHPIHWDDWSHLIDAVRTGEPVVPATRGMGAFEFLAANPGYGAVFGGGMGNLSSQETEPILAAYDFSGFAEIVDVGGGSGGLLAAVLAAAPHARGILADQRADEMGAGAVLEAAGVTGRTRIDPVGLFGPVPAGADAYLLKHIIHDWPRPQAVQILRAVRQAVPADGKVLIMEFVLPDEDSVPHLGKLVDLWLMLLVGGQERTSAQYADLLAEAGFELVRVVGTGSPISIVEARPV